jgi:hypothetical protein
MHPWSIRLGSWLLAVFGAWGCLPFVVPPARVSIGSATHIDAFPGSLPAESEQEVLSLRGSAHPLDLADGMEGRLLDFGLGYHAELAPPGGVPTVHGPYLELGAYPLAAELGPRVHLRGGMYGTVDGLLRSGMAEPGLGGSLGLLLELASSGSGAFLSRGGGPVVAGYARGQWGFGLYTSASVRDFSDGAYRALSVGVSVRLPLVVGVLCCALPKFSARRSQLGRRRTSSPRWVREPARPSRDP